MSTKASGSPAEVSSNQLYALAPMSVILDAELSEGAKLLYVYLDWRQGTNPTSWPSLPTIAKDLGKSEETVGRWRRELEQHGYLTTTRSNGHSNRYALHHRIERYGQAPADPPQKCTPSKNDGIPPAKMTHEHDHEQYQETAPPANPPEQPSPNPPEVGSWEALAKSKRPEQTPTRKKGHVPGNGQHRAMYVALVEASQIDAGNKRNQGMLNAEAKALLDAGWTPDNVAEFCAWWQDDPWRRQHTPHPTVKQIREKIKLALRPDHPQSAPMEVTDEQRFG